jgi:hypothetical protein
MEVEKNSRLLCLSSFDGANSAAERWQMDHQGTTLPLSFNTHWAISLPSFFAGPSKDQAAPFEKEKQLSSHKNIFTLM